MNECKHTYVCVLKVVHTYIFNNLWMHWPAGHRWMKATVVDGTFALFAVTFFITRLVTFSSLVIPHTYIHTYMHLFYALCLRSSIRGLFSTASSWRESGKHILHSTYMYVCMHTYMSKLAFLHMARVYIHTYQSSYQT